MGCNAGLARSVPRHSRKFRFCTLTGAGRRGSATLAPVTVAIWLLALLTTGLQAGTYYTWASGVMPGLARVDDRTFVHAMWSMNRAIVNPVFLASFLGAPVLTVLTAVLANGDPAARVWAVFAAVFAVLTVLITALGNIPLNNALDGAWDGTGSIDSVDDPAAVRSAFESPWRRLNALRAVTSTLSLATIAMAAVV